MRLIIILKLSLIIIYTINIMLLNQSFRQWSIIFLKQSQDSWDLLENGYFSKLNQWIYGNCKINEFMGIEKSII